MMVNGRRKLVLCACLIVFLLATAYTWKSMRANRISEKDQKPESISFWTVNEYYADYMRRCADRYNEQSEGAKIELDVKVYSGSFIVDQISKSILNDDQIPDMADIRFIDLHQFISQQEHSLFFYPLDSLIVDGVSPRQVALTPFSFNNVLLALPYDNGEMAMFLNKRLLDKYDIDVDSLNTWEDLYDLAPVLKRDSVSLMALDVINCDYLLALMLQMDLQTANLATVREIAGSDAFQTMYRQIEALVRSSSVYVPEEFDIYNQRFYDLFESDRCLCVIAPVEFSRDCMVKMPEMKGSIEIVPLIGTSSSRESICVAQYGTTILAKSRKIGLVKDFLKFAKLDPQNMDIAAEILYVKGILDDGDEGERNLDYSRFEAFFGNTEILDRTVADAIGFEGGTALPEIVVSRVPDLLSAVDGKDDLGVNKHP